MQVDDQELSPLRSDNISGNFIFILAFVAAPTLVRTKSFHLLSQTARLLESPTGAFIAAQPQGRSKRIFTGGGVTASAAAGSLRGNEPSQALRASSPEGRAKTVEGVFLASPFERLPPVGGRCRTATKRGQGVTEGDGEGAPAPLRGAAAAAAEGPSNRRSAKNAFSEATSIFPLRPLLWDYQGRVALDSWIQRVEIAATLPR